MTTTVAHVLVEQGKLDYDTPITEVWPEYGANGKGGTTLRHVLLHQAGVPGVPAETTPEDLCDWQKMVDTIAVAEPWWEPGTKTGYHAQTYGYIIGELVKRSTGKTIAEFLRDDIAGPLGIANELFFGVPQAELGRLAVLETAPGTPSLADILPPEMPMFKAVPLAVMPSAEFGNRADVLSSDIPAGGTMTARAIARLYAALLGEVDGVQLLSPGRTKEVTAFVNADQDEIVGFPSPRALGYDLGRPGGDPEATSAVFGAVGMGGSAAWADPNTGVTFGLTKNRFNSIESSAVDQIGEIVAKATA